MSAIAVKFAFTQEGITAAEKWILVCLCNHYNQATGVCNPTIDRLVIDSCFAHVSVSRIIKRLLLLGRIMRERPASFPGVPYNYVISGLPGRDGRGNTQPDELEVDQFEVLWREYPRKQGKQQASKTFHSLKIPEKIYLVIIKDIRYKTFNVWCKRDIKFVPHLSTYLNGRRWEDELLNEEKKKNAHLRGI